MNTLRRVIAIFTKESSHHSSRFLLEIINKTIKNEAFRKGNSIGMRAFFNPTDNPVTEI